MSLVAVSRWRTAALKRAGLGVPGTSTPYIGQIATGCIIPNVYVGVANEFTTRSPHIARDSVSQIKICIANFCLDPGAGLKQTNNPTYTDRTFWAAFETSSGVVTPFKFGGAASHVAVQGEYFVETDFLPVTLNAGDAFFIRIGQRCANGEILFWNTRAQGSFQLLPNYGAGEMALWGYDAPTAVSAPAAAWATSGGVYNYNDATNGVCNRPFAIVGATTTPSLAFIGDSRSLGAADNWDASGDIGEIARTVGQRYGYVCAGSSGTPAATLIDPAKLVPSVLMPKLAQYCSHLIDESGGADCTGSTDVAVTFARKQSLWAMWPKLSRVATLTLPPQTINPSGGPTTASPLLYDLSALLKASANARVFDVASVVSTGSRSNYVWSNPTYSADGTHESQAGNLAIKNSGVIDLAWFASL